MNAWIVVWRCLLLLQPIRCFWWERCSTSWVRSNATLLDETLAHGVCGQHLAVDIVKKALKYHWSDPSPQKPLVMSFHGPVGTGKTHFANLIRDSIFVKKSESKYYHFISVPALFPHMDKEQENKEVLRKRLQSALYSCERSVIVIEEAHTMSPRLLEAVRPFIDSSVEAVMGFKANRATFIFLSNTAWRELVDLAHSYHSEGKRQDEIPYLQAENTITTASFSDTSAAFHQNLLLARHLIDYYVPFLPMEVTHVECCISKELMRRRLYPRSPECEQNWAEQAQRNIAFYPKNNPVFAEHGCKPVGKAVALVDTFQKSGCGSLPNDEL